MGLIKLSEQQNKYNDEFFEQFTKYMCKMDGVIQGMLVTEYEESGKVFIDIGPGSFVRNGKIYIMKSATKGNEPNSFHNLEMTQFTDSVEVTNGYNGTTRVGSGYLRFYVVESVLSWYPNLEPKFEIKRELLPSDMMIAMRYIKPIAREKDDTKITDSDQLKGQLLIGDGDDPDFEEYFATE